MSDFTAAQRKKYATVHVGGKDKYPIKDAESARNALRLIGKAKPALTPSQRAAVIRKAAKFGVHPAED